MEPNKISQIKKLVVMLPAYNEGEKIREVVKAIPESFNGIGERLIVVIDDGSTDNTLEQIKDLDVTIIKHNKNLGLGRSFKDGLKKALLEQADYLVNIDADGQFNPQDIAKLLEPLLNNEADFVTASRFVDKKFIPRMPKVKLWGNFLMSKLISMILQQKHYDVSCGFRAYNREAILRLNLFGRFTYTQEVFLDLGFKGLRLAEVPVEVKYFSSRRSSISSNLFSYGWRTLKIILRAVRDYKPLKFFGGLGIIIFSAGLLLDLSLLIYYFNTGSFSPYKIIGFTGAFLNILGIIIFIIGLMADMLYRIRMNQEEIIYRMKKAQYIKK